MMGFLKIHSFYPSSSQTLFPVTKNIRLILLFCDFLLLLFFYVFASVAGFE